MPTKSNVWLKEIIFGPCFLCADFNYVDRIKEIVGKASSLKLGRDLIIDDVAPKLNHLLTLKSASFASAQTKYCYTQIKYLVCLISVRVFINRVCRSASILEFLWRWRTFWRSMVCFAVDFRKSQLGLWWNVRVTNILKYLSVRNVDGICTVRLATNKV